MKQKLYEKVTQYILNNDPCTSEVVRDLKVTSSQLSAILCSIRKTDQKLYEVLYGILQKNAYKNIKGYKLALEIIEKKISKDEVKDHFNLKLGDVINSLEVLKKHNADLYNLAFTYLNKPNIATTAKEQSKEKVIYKNEKLAAYIIDNNATIEQAMEHFNYTRPSFWAAIYNLKRTDILTYNKVKEIIGPNSSRNAMHMVDGITKYEQICFHIIKEKVSLAETAEHFNIPIIAVSQAVFTMAYKYKPKLFKAIKTVLNNLPSKKEKMIQYMVDNKLTVNETAKVFKVTRNTILNNILNIKDINPTLFAQAEQLKKKDKKYIQLADYIIDNNATIEEAATKFNMTNQMVRIYIHNMKKVAPEIYEKVSVIL